MRIALLLLLATVVPWALPLVAQPAAPLANLYDRTRLSLNGEWAYIVEPFGRAIDNRNIRRDFPADQQAQPGGPLIEYDWEASPTLQVPGDWNHQDPTLWHYEGAVWHRKRFGAEVPDGMRAFLYFEAANYIAHVFLNNEKLGVHEGGFTPFAFEVTDHLRAGADANSLVVAVDNTRRAHQIPSKRFDWWNYGGLTRPVWIVLVPDTHIHDYTVRFDDTDGDVITAEVVLDGPDRGEQPVTLRIPELNVEATATTGLTGVATLRVRPEGLTRWSPEDPQRYTVSIEAGADRVEEPMGFRTVAVRGTDILVNGEPVFLRGISIHEEAFDEQGRRATSPEDLRALMEAAKGLNTNFVRLAHYPHSEQMTRLADSLGLLVWSEVPIYWEDITYNNPQTLGLARAMVEAMVERDKNRASIIIWSVANETPIEEHRLTFLRTLIQDVRTLDPTRLVSAALKSTSVDAAAADGAGGSVAAAVDPNRRIQLVDDPLGAYLDVLAVNTYVGWYGTAYPDAIQHVEWRTPFGKPMVLSEFGAGALHGHRGDKMEMWTEEFQAYLLDETMKVAVETPFMRGTAPWLLKDFRSPRRWHGRFQQFWNRKGLVSETGAQKLAYDTMADWYRRLADQWPSPTTGSDD